MNNEDFLKLTDTIYNVTEFILDESLKNKTRETALEILSNLNLFFSKNPKATPQEKNKLSIQIEKDIEVLGNCLELAHSREYLHPFLIIKDEYDKIRQVMKEYEKSEEEPVIEEETVSEEPVSEEQPTILTPAVERVLGTLGVGGANQSVSERQKKILEILEKEEKAQVCNFIEFFPNMSKRTLRRDLDNLLKKELIIRAGEWNQIFYKLKGDRTGDGTEDRTEEKTKID